MIGYRFGFGPFPTPASDMPAERSPMFRVLASIFVILHGLVHFWYVTLSLQLVEFQTDMGWTGRSWLLSGLLGVSTVRLVAVVMYALAALAFVFGGIGLVAGAAWAPSVLLAAAVFSAAFILIFWDGSTSMLVQKGLLGLLINLVIIGLILVRGRASMGG
jgi:hypothetical protein